MKRKDSIAPYKSPNDEWFKVCKSNIYSHPMHMEVLLLQWLKKDFLGYLHEWEKEVDSLPGLKPNEKQKRCMSQETLRGLKITGICICVHNFKH